MALLLCGSSAAAADYYVALDGDDNGSGAIDQPLATIDQALALAGNGDVVSIRAGTYRLMEQSPSSIHITLGGATETSFLTLQAYPGEEVVLLGSLDTAGQSWESVDGNLWRLPADFLVHDPSGMFQGQIRVEHVMKDVGGTRSHADIVDLVSPGEWTKADDAGAGCPSDNGGCFIYLYPFAGEDPNDQDYELSQRSLFYTTGDVSFMTVRGLTIYYTQSSAFSFEGGRAQLVEDNVLGHNSNGNDNAYSLFVSYGGGVIIRNNRAFDSKYWGGFSNSKGITLMDMDPSDPALIEGNEVYDIVGQGITSKSGVANVVVQRNYVHDVGVGIEPPGPRCHWTVPDCVLGDPEYYPGGGWEIRENALVRCGHGVSMRTLPEAEGGIPNRIYNNVFYENVSSGVDLTLSNTGTMLANNIFAANARGIFLNHGGSGEPVGIDAFMPVYSSHQNLFYDNEADYLLRPDWTGPEGSGTPYSLDEIISQQSQEDGSLGGDPLFVDAAAADFHLEEASPAKVAGDGSLYELAAVDMGMYPLDGAAGGAGGGGAGGSGGEGGSPGAGTAEDDGGCGCTVVGAARTSDAWAALLAASLLAARRRQRRRG